MFASDHTHSRCVRHFDFLRSFRLERLAPDCGVTRLALAPWPRICGLVCGGVTVRTCAFSTPLRMPNIWVCGPTLRASYEFSFEPGTVLFVADCQPSLLHDWFGSAIGYANTIVGLHKDADRFDDVLLQTEADKKDANWAERVKAIALRFVVACVARAHEPSPIGSLARLRADEVCGQITRALASDLHLSERHARRRFEQEIGLSPEIFDQACRIRRAISLSKRQPKLPLAQLALDCGYSDQSHMTREFGKLAGFTPGMLRNRKARHFESELFNTLTSASQ